MAGVFGIWGDFDLGSHWAETGRSFVRLFGVSLHGLGLLTLSGLFRAGRSPGAPKTLIWGLGGSPQCRFVFPHGQDLGPHVSVE